MKFTYDRQQYINAGNKQADIYTCNVIFPANET